MVQRLMSPQQTGVPSVWRPHENRKPALIALSVSPLGGNDCPSELSPQHSGEPSGRSAQVWSNPALIVVKIARGADRISCVRFELRDSDSG